MLGGGRTGCAVRQAKVLGPRSSPRLSSLFIRLIERKHKIITKSYKNRLLSWQGRLTDVTFTQQFDNWKQKNRKLSLVVFLLLFRRPEQQTGVGGTRSSRVFFPPRRKVLVILLPNTRQRSS